MTERALQRIAIALGLPSTAEAATIEVEAERMRRVVTDLRAMEWNLLSALEILGVSWDASDEVIGPYWLPAPSGQCVAGDAVEAARARRVQVEAMRLALRNVRALAKRLRRSGHAAAERHLLRLCDEAGVHDEVMR